jgi:hypothetical protein
MPIILKDSSGRMRSRWNDIGLLGVESGNNLLAKLAQSGPVHFLAALTKPDQDALSAPPDR